MEPVVPFPRDPRAALLTARALAQRVHVVDSCSLAVQAPADLRRMEAYLAPARAPGAAAAQHVEGAGGAVEASYLQSVRRLYGAYHVLAPGKRAHAGDAADADAADGADAPAGRGALQSHDAAVYWHHQYRPGAGAPEYQQLIDPNNALASTPPNSVRVDGSGGRVALTFHTLPASPSDGDAAAEAPSAPPPAAAGGARHQQQQPDAAEVARALLLQPASQPGGGGGGGGGGALKHALLAWPPPRPETALTVLGGSGHTVCTAWLPLAVVADDALGAFMRDAATRRINGATYVQATVRARATLGPPPLPPSAGGSGSGGAGEEPSSPPGGPTPPPPPPPPQPRGGGDVRASPPPTQPVPLAHDAATRVTVSLWLELVPGLQAAWRVLPDQLLPNGFYNNPAMSISSALAEAPIHVRWRDSYAAAVAASAALADAAGGPPPSGAVAPHASSRAPVGPLVETGVVAREIALLEDEVGRWLNTRHMALIPQYMAEPAQATRLAPTRGCRAGYVIVTQSTSDTR